MIYRNYKFKLFEIFVCNMYFNMAVENPKSKYSYVYFAEQYLANLDLRAFRSGKKESVIRWSRTLRTTFMDVYGYTFIRQHLCPFWRMKEGNLRNICNSFK